MPPAIISPSAHGSKAGTLPDISVLAKLASCENKMTYSEFCAAFLMLMEKK